MLLRDKEIERLIQLITKLKLPTESLVRTELLRTQYSYLKLTPQEINTVIQKSVYKEQELKKLGVTDKGVRKPKKYVMKKHYRL